MKGKMNNYIQRAALVALWIVLTLKLVWAQTFNERYIFEQAVNFSGIIEQNDTLYLFGENAVNFNPYPTMPMIAKVKGDGAFLSYQKILGDSSLNYATYGGRSFFRKGNKVIMQGGAGGYFANSYGMVAMAEDFSLKWLRIYEASGSNSGFGFLSSLILEDNSLMLCGFEFHNYTGDISILVHTDSLGEEKWRKEYGESGYSYHLWASFPETDTTLILGFGIKNHSEEHWHSMLMRIDTAGNEIDRWINDTEGTYEPRRILRTEDGGYLFVGKVFKEYVSDTGQPLFQGYICKLDSEWHKEWEQKIGFRGKTTFSSVIELEDGDFVAVGNVLDTFQLADSYYRKGWMVKFDIDGHILWQQNPYKEGYAESYLFDVVELPEGDLVACGVSISHLGEDYPQRGWLVRVHADGCMDWGCFTGLEDFAPPDDSPYVIAPNPVRDYFRIAAPADVLEGDVGTIESVMAYDVSGRMILHEHYPVGTTSVEVATSGWTPGIYFIIVNDHWIKKIIKN